MSEDFRPGRDDGRSDARVVVDLVSGAGPDTLFRYEEFEEALARGLPDGEHVSRQRITAAVRNANRPLLREYQRILDNVVNTGYRLARADEHRSLAIKRETSADRQLRRGLLILKNVRLDEMDEPGRTAHLAQLQISQALYSQMQGLERRQKRQDAAIATLTQRISVLEKVD